MAARKVDIMLTAVAPAIWGSTYYITTELLPDGYPLTIALLRALPAGLILMLVVRQLPSGIWWHRSLILGALNFSIFWWMLFISAYRLPGGVAATVSALQPLIVIFVARFLLGSKIRLNALLAATFGLIGVAILILTPAANLDKIGVFAGLVGALAMSLGTVLSRKWQPPVPPLTFTAWQLVGGGALLLPLAFILEPTLPTLSLKNYIGLFYLGAIGAALTYFLWFRGISKLEPSAVSALGFLSPVSAIAIGWLLLAQSLTKMQFIGVTIVLCSVWLSQKSRDK